MKTYEEMAQSVIRRAKAHKAARNRWIVGSAAAVLALCACVGVMGNRSQPDTTMQKVPVAQVTQTVKMEPRVTFLYAEGEDVTQLQQGIILPSKCELRVVDVSDMTDDEINALALEELAYADELRAGYPDAMGAGCSQYNPAPRIPDDPEHLLVTFIYSGHFVLNAQDPSEVESIQGATKNGALMMPWFSRVDGEEGYDPFAYPQSCLYYMESDTLQQYYYEPYGGFEFGLCMGNGLYKYLNEKPVPLSQLSETFTFTVTFTDGTVETHTIDMIFNDNGQIYTLYRGAETAV